MAKKASLLFTIFFLAIASAATYKVNLTQSAVVNGKALKAGEYRLNVEESKVTIADGRSSIEAPVKVENGDTKFNVTVVRYTAEGGQTAISEIRIGGTKTKLVFNP